MNKVITCLGLVMLMAACQPKNIEITFQIDMSEIIQDIEDPSTIGVVGSGPLNWEITPLAEKGNGIYAVTFDWPLKDTLTIEYTFIHSHDTFDEGNIGEAAYRKIKPTPGKQTLPLVKWGELPALAIGDASPSPMLKVERADTDAESKALKIPFNGVTSQGVIEPNLFSIKKTNISTSKIRTAVQEFLSSLSPSKRANCTFPINDNEWRRWSNIDYYERKGVGLKELTKTQKELVFQILKESLSLKGFKKTQDIMKMEQYLARLTGEHELLGSDLYWFSFMGTPSDTQPWGWQIDGHHLVINYFILGDQIVMTPTFMGSEPNHIVDGENAGTRTFKQEERLGLKFYKSLNPQQKKAATLFDKKDYNYLQAGAYSDNAIIPYKGLKLSSLDKAQRRTLEELIFEYIGNIKEGHAEIRMEEVLEHLEETHFSWIGATNGSEPFYYRIHSPVVMIEFDHQKPIFLEGSAPSKKHVHTIVRTPNGNDYGKDLLKQHLETHEHK
ncbi:DUF3500 domain-containing protein [uncultured Arcticibacterium sp.]|mgnify:CR=1 FL=1|uniref:DUF3500 domain-containing protein n=1 Tax=uncultured Arcticibacterium sp. TaxID=2173042 RepID=UPI0030F714E7